MKKKNNIKTRLLTFLVAGFVILSAATGTNILDGNSFISEAEALTYTDQVEEIEMPSIDSNVEKFKEFVEEQREKEYEAFKALPIEEKIAVTCDKYGIPSDIVLAIARLETGHFKSRAYLEYNNPGGMSIREVPIKYDTIEEGVEAFVSNLANNYFAIGLTTPEAIGKKYCPANYDHWVNIVTQLM